MAVKRRRTRTTPVKKKVKARYGFKRLLAWMAVGCFLVVAIVGGVYAFWASTFEMEDVKQIRERSTIYDMDGRVYSRMAGENRITVPLAEVSPYFRSALLAREDARFYQHSGIDYLGIVRAVIRNLQGSSQGASTLTQQLARNSFPERVGSSRSIHRKLLEAFVAVRIEQHFPKDAILEHYVNRIYFGAGVYGVETASLVYFGKHAKDLDLSESAMLAGIIRSPTRLSPFRDVKIATRERDVVLSRMDKLNMITHAEAADTVALPLKTLPKKPVMVQENYAMDAVVRELEVILTDSQLSEGGLKVYTSIDPALQAAAQSSVDKQLAKLEARPKYAHPKRSEFTKAERLEEQQPAYLQGAVVVIDHRDGAIRAIIGGRDYADSKYNRAMPEQPQRSVGSTFKPFVYAAAFQQGLLPGTLVSDDRISSGELTISRTWSPDNSDGQHKGMLKAEEGLFQSRNTMTVRVGDLAGLDTVGNVAVAAGIEPVPRNATSLLGVFPVRLDRLTAAYSVFATGGMRRTPYIVERIDDPSGQIIYRAPRRSIRAMDPGVSWLVGGILQKAMEKGTGASVRTLGFTKPCAGKTGTTDDYHDAWFVGYTSSLTCGVWVGLDQPKPIMPRGYGSTVALPIWADIMVAASQKRYPAAELKPTVPLRKISVCAVSSALATNSCDRAGTAYNIDLPSTCIPAVGCRVHSGQVLSDRPQSETKPSSGGVLRSFRRFFGGD